MLAKVFRATSTLLLVGWCCLCCAATGGQEAGTLLPLQSPLAEELLLERLPPVEPMPEELLPLVGPVGESEAIAPPDDKPIKLWEGSFEAGINGTEGNSENFNIRAGAKLKRTTTLNALAADLSYQQNQSNGKLTANRAFFDGRYERFIVSTPWSWFAHSTAEHDEFKEFQFRWSADSGLGYRFIKNETTTLNGRVGAGTSREVGGPENRYRPEMTFALEFEHRPTKRQKFTASADYAPDVTDFNDCRMTIKAAWELSLDEAMRLNLKLLATDRYDSSPHGRKPHDVDYGVLLLWKF